MGEVTDKKNLFGLSKKPKNEEIEQYIALIKKEPDNDRNYIRLAELYARAGDEEKAIETYEKAALLFEKKGFYNKAKAVLKQALSINPDHGHINVLLADLDKADGLIKDAVVRYQIAVNYFIKQGNKAAAIAVLKKIVEILPQNTSYAIKLATILVSEKMYHDAEKILEPLKVSLKPAERSADYIAVLKLLYTAKGDDPTVGRELADALIRSGNYSNALAVLYKLIMAEPDATDLLERLAFLFEQMGETEKLIPLYKQIASIYGDRQEMDKRNAFYRKVLALSPQDTEALLALNEEGKLRDIISGKIDAVLSEETTTDDEEGIEIEFDDHGAPVKEEEEKAELDEKEQTVQKPYHSGPLIKEARVFINYRLFDRAIEKLTSFPSWRKDPDILDLLAKVYFEKGDVESGTETLFLLVEAHLALNDVARASEVFDEVRDLLESQPERCQSLAEQIAAARRSSGISPTEPQQPSQPIPLVAGKEYEDDEEKVVSTEVPGEKPFVLTGAEESSSQGVSPTSGIGDDTFADMARDLLNELQDLREPPQKKLDELEFFISIEDYHSATILLQELIASYPESKMLAGFKDLIPMNKEENIAETLEEVKTSLSKTMQGEKSPEDFYNMGIVHLSMGMLAEAITYFEQTVRLDPANVKYLIALADAWAQSGKNQQSIKYYRQAAEKTSDVATKIEILEKIASLYYASGDAEGEQRTREEIRLIKEGG